MADLTMFEEPLLKNPEEEVISGLISLYRKEVMKKVQCLLFEGLYPLPNGSLDNHLPLLFFLDHVHFFSFSFSFILFIYFLFLFFLLKDTISN